MFAIVTKVSYGLGAHKIETQDFENLRFFYLGRSVGRRKLRRLLRPFSDDYVFSSNIKFSGFSPFDTSNFKDDLLFSAFERYIFLKGGLNLKVGIVHPDHAPLERNLNIISRSSNVTIVTGLNADAFCHNSILHTGTCPEIVTTSTLLYDCDVIFAPIGLSNFSGTIFGNGGYTLCDDSITLPPECQRAVNLGAQPISIAAALSFNDPRYLPFALKISHLKNDNDSLKLTTV